MNSLLNMRDTKHEWIGNIPSHWDLKKVKYVFWNRNENNKPIKTENLISLTVEKGVIPHSEKTGGGNKPKENLSKYKLVYPGDIVLNSMNVIAGAVGISKYFGLVSPVYYMLVPKDLDYSNEYFHHLFRTETFQKSLYGLGNGILIKENEETGKLNTIRMRISMDKLGDQFIPVPPAKEQKLISSYLDKKTEQIDKLIDKIQKKIELLEEQRTFLINQCVTKGLNPNDEMKDSGVEWINKIPKHWVKSTLGRFSKLITDGSHQSPLTTSEGKYYVTVSNVKSENFIDFDTCSKISEGDFLKLEKEGCRPLHGDILITKDGTIGRGCVVDNNNFVILSSLGIIRIPKGHNPHFFLLFLLSHGSVQEMFSNVRGSGITRLTISLLKNLPILIPKIDEQDRIVRFCQDKTTPINRTIKLSKKKIEKLKEYRQSLIFSTVTGKILITDKMI